MDFERGLGKRGQEGVTLTTLLLIILGVVAVVVVILFFTGFFDKLKGGTNQLPSDLQAAVSACELSGSSGLTTDYCLTYRKVTINGVEQYQTCNGEAMKNYISSSKKLACGDNKVTSTSADQYCAVNKLKQGTVIEGDTNGCPAYQSAVDTKAAYILCKDTSKNVPPSTLVVVDTTVKTCSDWVKLTFKAAGASCTQDSECDIGLVCSTTTSTCIK